MSTLLDKAKATEVRGRHPYLKCTAEFREQFELAMAYAAGEITARQVESAIRDGNPSKATSQWCATVLLKAVRMRLLQPVPAEKDV